MGTESDLIKLDLLRKIEGLSRKKIYKDTHKKKIIYLEQINPLTSSAPGPACLPEKGCFNNKIKTNPGLQIHQICELPIHYNFESLHPKEDYVECTLSKYKNELPAHLRNHKCECMKLPDDSGITGYICTDTLKNKAL